MGTDSLSCNEIIRRQTSVTKFEMELSHQTVRPVDQWPLPIIGRFTRYCDKKEVLQKAAKLFGTRIYLNEDLCRASRRKIINNELKTNHVKQAQSDSKIAHFVHRKPIIEEKPGPHIKVGTKLSEL